MIQSFFQLYKFPYNKLHPFFAFQRFIQWKFIRLFKIKNFRFKLWKNRYIFLNYDSFHSMWIMYHYLVDWEEFNLIQKYIKDGDVAFDVGANMGYYSLWMSKFIGNHGELFSFEPDQLNFEKLKQNINLNQLSKHVHANQLAVSSSNGKLLFTVGLDAENHIAQNREGSVIEVPCVALDCFVEVNKIGRIAYLKIDVEGFEFSVLQGCANLLRHQSIDIIQLEINATIQNSNHTVDEILELLHLNQYQLCAYNVKLNRLEATNFSAQRENYFAVYDIEKVNEGLGKFSE